MEEEKRKGFVPDKLVPVLLSAIVGFVFWGLQSIITTMDRLVEMTARTEQSQQDTTRRIGELGIANMKELSRLEKNVEDHNSRLMVLERNKK